MAPLRRLRAINHHLRRHGGSDVVPIAAAKAAEPIPHDDAPGLRPGELQHFKEHGFVVAKGLLLESDLDDVVGAYDALITERARPLLAEGLLSSLREELPFHSRLAALRNELPTERHGELTSKIDIYEAQLPEMFAFLFTKRLLAGVGSIIGDEITLSPIQHIRPFMAGTDGNMSAGPQWHMDQAVTLEEADEAEIITAWIPFVDTYPENGCLQFVDNLAPDASWRADRSKHLVVGHHNSPHVDVRDRERQPLEVPNEFLEPGGRAADDVAVAEAIMEKGDVLLFNAYVPHRGGTHSTPDSVRWSIDLRFQKTGTPTGRPHWPEFILQSPSDPSIVQDSYEEWCQRWDEGLASSHTDLHRQPPADAPLSIGDRVRLLGEKKGGMATVALVKKIRVSGSAEGTKYVLERMDGGETVVASRADVELF